MALMYTIGVMWAMLWVFLGAGNVGTRLESGRKVTWLHNNILLIIVLISMSIGFLMGVSS